MLPFLELDPAIVKDMVTVNITAATYLCHQVDCCNNAVIMMTNSNGTSCHGKAQLYNPTLLETHLT